MKIRIFYEDTDAGGIVYHANYIKFCERARSEMAFLSSTKFGPSAHLVVAGLNAKFVHPSVLGDILEVRTSVKEVRGAQLVLNQNIYKISSVYDPKNDDLRPAGGMLAGDGGLIFESEITLAYIKNGRPSRLPKEIAAIFDGDLGHC